MLDRKLVIAALAAQPSLDSRRAYYRRMIEKTLSFAFQSRVVQSTDVAVRMAWEYRQRADRLGLLQNALGAALHLLDPRQRQVVKWVMDRGIPLGQAAALMQVDGPTMRAYWRVILAQLGRDLEFLGFGNRRFLAYFDVEPVLVCALDQRWRLLREEEGDDSALAEEDAAEDDDKDIDEGNADEGEDPNRNLGSLHVTLPPRGVRAGVRAERQGGLPAQGGMSCRI